MFLQFYGLREQPFGVTPDPHLLYFSPSHREALASLIYGIETGRGFMALIAEPGMGKTTLLFHLMERLRNSARTVFLFQTQCTHREFLCNLIADLGIDPGDRDVSSLQRELNESLVREAQMGRRFLLIIDEAQNLDNSVLESVRMLSNFETPRKKLMQIVLAGQPPLANRLAQVELQQLRQRVSILCHLEALPKEQVAPYIRYRLEAAGYKGGPLFTEEAMRFLAEQSMGIPRNINNLCFHALSLNYAKRERKVDISVMQEVFNDLDLELLMVQRPRPRRESPAPEDSGTDLNKVTINSSSQSEASRSGFPRGGRTHPSSYAESGRRRRPRKDRSARWLAWAVVLVAVILMGEIFWAYLPPGVPQKAIKKSVSEAIQEVKAIAAKGKLLKSTVHNEAKDSAGSTHQDADFHTPKPNHGDQAYLGNAATPGNSALPRPSSTLPASSNALPSTGEISGQPIKQQKISVKADSGREGKPTDSPAGGLAASAALPKARVAIEANVSSGQIILNGKTQSGWETPHIFSLPLGTYRVSVTKAGYATWFREVQVTNDSEKWIIARLKLPRGVVVIATDPPGMQVFIDGKSYGPSEVETALSAGNHSYQVIPPSGRQPVSGTFVLKPGEILTRRIKVLSSTGTPDAENRGGPSLWKQEVTNAGGGGNIEPEF